MNLVLLASPGILSSYNLIIGASVIIILSFFFSEFAKRTNIPSVLMLIVLGVLLQFALKATGTDFNFFPVLELLGIVGLIMIVLEAALELKLDRNKLMPISISFAIALVGLLVSTLVAAEILQVFFKDMTVKQAWIYATPLSILSSAIIIPSVNRLRQDKKEFHIYESTFSDILGIMMFYFLTGSEGDASSGSGFGAFLLNVVLTIVISLISSYAIVLIFQKIQSHVKLFLLIAVLLLLYAVGKKLHLSSLIIILVFGLLIANIKLFFPGRFQKYLDFNKIHHIYEELHVITLETAFVVRTFFFVIFGITISLNSLTDGNVALISALLVLSIYLIRYVLTFAALGKDIFPQVFIAPRGLITVLLFYAIPVSFEYKNFNTGILLFVIIATSIIMTIAMIYDKRRSGRAISRAQSVPVGAVKWNPKSV